MTPSRRAFLLNTIALGGASVARPMLEGVSPAGQTRSLQPPASTPAANPFASRRNWGRWGADDQKGAVNLITPQKRAAAAGLVKTGRVVSLSRPFEPEQHFIRINERVNGGRSVVDHYGFLFHGVNVTHLDALCHMWDRDGMWNGRDPAKEVDTHGVRFADIAAFADGLITRGVLLDVPRHRGTSHVTLEHPVEGAELAAVAERQDVKVEPGDALLVYSGREAFVRETKTAYGPITGERPGLAGSCARVFRDWDVAVLGWDMLDRVPDPDGLPFPVHGILYSYGVPLLDNALLEPLAQACADERRYEFLFVALPLKIPRGTGSPVNPIALF